LEEDTIPLVFIHGLKGSVLKDDAGYTYFINLWQGLGCSSPQLALPLEWEDGKQKTDKLHASEIFHSIAWLPVYGPFLTYINGLARSTYTFPYDWRRDLNETTERFQNFLREIYRKHNCKIQIVAHSMGGLITLGAINTHNGLLINEPAPLPDRDNVKPSADPATAGTSKKGSSKPNGESEKVIDLVHSIIFAGCPFRTGVGFLKDMTAGVPNGRNWKILSQEVLFTFPSVYTFFPTTENPQILEGENLVPIDFYSHEDWIKYKLGIFKNKAPTPEQLEHLKKCTSQAKLFRSKLVALQDVKYPPIAVLSSHSVVTERRYHLVNGDLSFENPVTGMGDGRIINATPPDGIPNKEYETPLDHGALLNDTKLVHQILADLIAIK